MTSMISITTRMLALLGTLGIVACTGSPGQDASGNVAGGPPVLSPLYDVTPDMLRPDGTMRNGLLPMNPNDQS